MARGCVRGYSARRPPPSQGGHSDFGDYFDLPLRKDGQCLAKKSTGARPIAIKRSRMQNFARGRAAEGLQKGLSNQGLFCHFGPNTSNRASGIVRGYPLARAAGLGCKISDLGPADGPKCVPTRRRPRRGPKFCSPKLLRHSERTRPDGKHLAHRGGVESADFGLGANWPCPPPPRVFERRLRCPPRGRPPGRPLPAARVSTRPATWGRSFAILQVSMSDSH